MKDKKTRLELLAEFSARMRLTPDLFDEACRRAADRVHELDAEKLAILLGPRRFGQGEIDLLPKMSPPPEAAKDE